MFTRVQTARDGKTRLVPSFHESGPELGHVRYVGRDRQESRGETEIGREKTQAGKKELIAARGA